MTVKRNAPYLKLCPRLGAMFAEITSICLMLGQPNGALVIMTNEIDRHLGKRLRQRRRTLGLTQQQIAEAVGVRFQQIQKYECGANRISAARLWLLAKALEAPVAAFFEGLDDDLQVSDDDSDEHSRQVA